MVREERRRREPDHRPPLPFLVDGEEAYRVHKQLDSRRWGGTLHYVVDWEGFSPEERSWVNAGDILDPTLTEEFHRTHPVKPIPRPHGRSGIVCFLASGAARSGRALLQRRLPYCLLRTTRGSHLLNINHSHSGLHFPSFLIPGTD